MKHRNQDTYRQEQGSNRGDRRPGGRKGGNQPRDHRQESPMRSQAGQGWDGPTFAGVDPPGMRGTQDHYGQRNGPWYEQGLGANDYPYDRNDHRAEARHGGYGMNEAEHSYGDERYRSGQSGHPRQEYRPYGSDNGQNPRFGRPSDDDFGGYGYAGYGMASGRFDRRNDSSGHSDDHMQGRQRSDMHPGFQSRRGLGPRSYARSDERIREELNERLMDDEQVDATEISVQVKDGTVTLSGSVSERWEKHRAEDIADACGGVRDVQNQIRLTRTDHSDKDADDAGSASVSSKSRSRPSSSG